MTTGASPRAEAAMRLALAEAAIGAAAGEIPIGVIGERLHLSVFVC